MSPRRDVDPLLLAQARRGQLTSSNTRKGTPERQAVDRVTFLRRRALHPELTARQAHGHPASGDVNPSISIIVGGPPRFLIVQGLSRRDTRRAARYGSLVSQLDDGAISGRAFSRRVGAWRPIVGYRFLSDPDAVLAIIEQRRAEDAEIFVYESGRAA
jgi:hypothetical protein